MLLSPIVAIGLRMVSFSGASDSIMHAAAGRFSAAIPLLLENGADPNARDHSDKSALDLNNLGAIAMLNLATKTSR
jgi:hypothetical protein